MSYKAIALDNSVQLDKHSHVHMSIEIPEHPIRGSNPRATPMRKCTCNRRTTTLIQTQSSTYERRAHIGTHIRKQFADGGL